MDTYVTMQGNLVADPIRKVVANGAAVTRFRIAASGRRFDRALNDWVSNDPVFMTVHCWRQLADNAFQCLHKGDTVLVHGRLVFREYDDGEGKRRSTVEVDASSIGPDMSRYMVAMSRPTRELEPVGSAVPEQSTGQQGADAAVTESAA